MLPADDVLVVLQLPRGNLETVCPRALVLAAITQALQEGRFADAWQLATVNRVRNINSAFHFVPCQRPHSRCWSCIMRTLWTNSIVCLLPSLAGGPQFDC